MATLVSVTAPASAQTEGDASPVGPTPEGAALFYKIGWSNQSTLSTIDADGSNNQVERSVSFGDFDYTPDGLKLVFRGPLSGGNNIFIENQDGAVFPVGIVGSEPELSPDGNRIVYTRRDTTINEDFIEVVNLSGQPLASLGQGRNATFSPDGTEIAFAKKATAVEIGCVGSPDTDSIVFTGLAVAPSTGGASSWILEPGREIRTDKYWHSISDPEYSPDGESMVFTTSTSTRVWNGNGGSSSDCIGSNQDNDFDIAVMPSDGGEVTSLTDEGDGEFDPADLNPSFSPDGSMIAFASGRTSGVIHALWLMEADGSDPREVLRTNRVDETDWLTALPEGAQVTITAFDAEATEAGPTPGTFLIERSGATDGPLEVDIDLDPVSTATSGADFAALPDTVTIPDGSSSVNLLVVPINDSLVEGSETIVAEVVDGGGGYFVGNPSSASITVIDRSAVHRPDAQVRRFGTEGYRGGNVYNTTGTGQSRTVASPRGTTVTFQIKAQNDGNLTEAFQVKGPAGNTSAYRVRYYAGTTEITDQVVAGTYFTPALAPGASHVVTAKVKVKPGAPAGSSLSRVVKVSRTGTPTVKDAVKLVVRRA